MSSWLSHSISVAAPVAIVGVLLSSLVGYFASSLRPNGPTGALVLFHVLVAGFAMALAIAAAGVRSWSAIAVLSVIFLATVAPPAGVWLFRRIYNSMPSTVIDASKLDGASSLRVFTAIVLPELLGALAAAVIAGFIVAWAEYIVAGVLLRNSQLFPIS